jgi:hypothetical protein
LLNPRLGELDLCLLALDPVALLDLLLHKSHKRHLIIAICLSYRNAGAIVGISSDLRDIIVVVPNEEASAPLLPRHCKQTQVQGLLPV